MPSESHYIFDSRFQLESVSKEESQAFIRRLTNDRSDNYLALFELIESNNPTIYLGIGFQKENGFSVTFTTREYFNGHSHLNSLGGAIEKFSEYCAKANLPKDKIPDFSFFQKKYFPHGAGISQQSYVYAV